MQAQSAAANAVMFDRSSGISCDECLERCSKHFQVIKQDIFAWHC